MGGARIHIVWKKLSMLQSITVTKKKLFLIFLNSIVALSRFEARSVWWWIYLEAFIYIRSYKISPTYGKEPLIK